MYITDKINVRCFSVRPSPSVFRPETHDDDDDDDNDDDELRVAKLNSAAYFS